MKKGLFILLITVLLLVLTVGIASAITDRELDDGRHPYVGLMVANDAVGNPMWRCSGTLLSPTIFLTAGHCTEPPTASATIWFDDDVESLSCPRDLEGNYIPGECYPFGGPTTVAGTPYTHPDYDPNAFFLFDLGVVVLETPVDMGEYGVLPGLDILDAMKTQRGKQDDRTFTAVGYGLQRINPVFVESERVRMYARPRLIQINTPGFTGDFSLLLSNNHSTGGTCFGDSGGPSFWVDSEGNEFVVAVTSTGDAQCVATGLNYRVDTLEILEWINGYLP